MTRQLLVTNLPRCHTCPMRHAQCAGGCACTVDGADIADHAGADYCPLPKPRFGTGQRPDGFERAAAERLAVAAERTRRQEAYHAGMDARGRAAWHRLHTEGVGQDEAWLEGWLRADVPCGECRAKARKILADRPPQFPLQAEWTFEFHNDINAALGKPLAAFADVAPLYAWP